MGVISSSAGNSTGNSAGAVSSASAKSVSTTSTAVQFSLSQLIMESQSSQKNIGADLQIKAGMRNYDLPFAKEKNNKNNNVNYELLGKNYNSEKQKEKWLEFDRFEPTNIFNGSAAPATMDGKQYMRSKSASDLNLDFYSDSFASKMFLMLKSIAYEFKEKLISRRTRINFGYAN